MKFLQILRKGSKKTNNNHDSIFTYDVNSQKKYLAKFDFPIDDIERSYFQYKCQVKILGSFKGLFINIFSLVGIAYYLTEIEYLKILRKKRSYRSIQRFDAIFISNDIPRNILPRNLSESYQEIKFGNSDSNYTLTKSDYKFIFSLMRRYPLSWHFIFKCIIKISMYSTEIQLHNPKALIAYTEFSFTSSVLTKYCETKNVKHINVMHGQKLFYIRDSFFRFHECYVWDESFKNLFITLRAEPNQFIIELPESVKFKALELSKKEFDITYYLAAESKEELEKISASLITLKEKGYTISIRPHPRYTNIILAAEIFKSFEIEKFQEISIEKSISRTKYAMSLYSTVLYQASNNGVYPIVDDLTNPSKYKKLSELHYDILSKKHFLLSDFIY